MFTSVRAIKACKVSRACQWCDERINVGEPAIRYCGMSYEGTFGQGFLHPECDEAEKRSRHHARDWDGFTPHNNERGKAWGEE